MKQRATKQKDVSEEYQLPPGTAWEYSDGSVRRERGRMVKRLPGTREITRHNARELQALGVQARLEHKREVMQEAANMAVADPRFKRYGKDAYLAEIAYTMQLAASTASNPRLVDAARFQVQETGYAEVKQQAAGGNTVDDLRGLVHELAQLAASVQPTVVDAVVTDAE